MSIIQKAGIGEYAVITLIDSTDVVREAVRLHSPMSDLSIQALGRLLTVTAFMSEGFKGAEKLSITYDTEGGLGRLVTAATRLKVRGYVENKDYELYDKDGYSDLVRGVLGGSLTVIKDLGLKEPYVGKCSIARGNISDDFSYYFTLSEQVPSAVHVDVVVEDGVVMRACGMFLQLLPGCPEEVKVMLQDIVRDFYAMSTMMDTMTFREMIADRFMVFDIEYYDTEKVTYECSCSKSRMDAIVSSLGKEEALDIIAEQGLIEIHCDFCNSYYRYTRDSVERLFNE